MGSELIAVILQHGAIGNFTHLSFNHAYVDRSELICIVVKIFKNIGSRAALAHRVEFCAVSGKVGNGFVCNFKIVGSVLLGF